MNRIIFPRFYTPIILLAQTSTSFASCSPAADGDLVISKTVSAMFALILGDDDPISLANIGYTTIRSFV